MGRPLNSMHSDQFTPKYHSKQNKEEKEIKVIKVPIIQKKEEQNKDKITTTTSTKNGFCFVGEPENEKKGKHKIERNGHHKPLNKKKKPSKKERPRSPLKPKK